MRTVPTQGNLFLQPGGSCWHPALVTGGATNRLRLNQEGNIDIYVIRASGRKPIRLTTDSGDDMAPTWSRDGNWVYFTSKRTGRDEVWKVSAEGGKAVPVTRNGGGTALESPDGKSLYYHKETFEVFGKCRSVAATRARCSRLCSGGLSARQRGDLFHSGAGLDGKSSIQFLSFATGKVKSWLRCRGRPFEGLSVSSDGRFLLFSQFDEAGSDLMLVENFR